MDDAAIDALLENAEIAETLDPGLLNLLRELLTAARASGSSAAARFESFGVEVSPDGVLTVDVAARDGFADWVWAAGDLALHAGPPDGVVVGEPRTVAEILGHGDAASDARPWARTKPAAAPLRDSSSGDDRLVPEGQIQPGLEDAHAVAVAIFGRGLAGSASSAPPPPPQPSARVVDAASVSPTVVEVIPERILQCTECGALAFEVATFTAADGSLACSVCGGATAQRQCVRGDGVVYLI